MWNWTAIGQNRLFRQWVGTADAVGDEHTLLDGKAHWDDARYVKTAEPGIVRSMNAAALLEGEVEVMYEGWPQMLMGPGFDVSNEHTNLWQSGPLAPMKLTVLAAPAVWWCCNARLRSAVPEVLDVAFEQGLANDPFSFTPVGRPTYIIPIIGSTDKLGRYEIGVHTVAASIDGTFTQDGVVAFIWSR